MVHLHHATRPHYDLRLEIGGTLKSYAVPKGPSFDPAQKHLAVHTEDHPLEYLEFEDVIPQGSYGAGPMIAWDLGQVHFLETTAEEGLARGKLDFELWGFKLKGRFSLIATGRRKAAEDKQAQAQWLLIKKQDAWAGQRDVLTEEPESVLSGLTIAELPRARELSAALLEQIRALGAVESPLVTRGLTPMLCAHTGAELNDPERLYELKVDGVRMLAEKREGAVLLRYRNGGLGTANYPEVARALETLPLDAFILDGEIVAFDGEGRPSFERLAPRIHAARPEDVRRALREISVQYLVFDLIKAGPYDLRKLPLRERKRLLAELVRGKGQIRVLDHLAGQGEALFQFCEANGLEGVVAKRSDSIYREGPRRTPDWVKIKCARVGAFVVMGFLTGKGARQALGALCVGSYQNGELYYRGRVGSGLEDAAISELTSFLAASERIKFPGVGPVPEDAKAAIWVRPELVVSIRFQDFTEEGRLRAPVFLGLNQEVEKEQCQLSPRPSDPEGSAQPANHAASAAQEARTLAAGRTQLTRMDKVFWPDDGYTKGDLVDYYLAVAPVLLPFLKDRPVMLVRHPDGIAGKSFYQWNVPQGTPDWLERLTLSDRGAEERGPRQDKTVFLVESSEALAHIANLGCIPLHVLSCRKHTLTDCDFLTLDFDIGEQPFSSAVTLALSLNEVLADAELVGFPKTSGQKGLHVLVPLGPGISFPIAKLLVELLGRIVTDRHPELATMERRVQLRGPRVLVDIGQTGVSRTIVAPYSVRAVPGATVSTPLRWEELHRNLNPVRFDLRSVPLRIHDVGDLWAEFFTARPAIAAAVARLERWVKGAKPTRSE